MCCIVGVVIYDSVTMNRHIVVVDVEMSAMLSIRKQHRSLVYYVLCICLINSSLQSLTHLTYT